MARTGRFAPRNQDGVKPWRIALREERLASLSDSNSVAYPGWMALLAFQSKQERRLYRRNRPITKWRKIRVDGTKLSSLHRAEKCLNYMLRGRFFGRGLE